MTATWCPVPWADLPTPPGEAGRKDLTAAPGEAGGSLNEQSNQSASHEDSQNAVDSVENEATSALTRGTMNLRPPLKQLVDSVDFAESDPTPRQYTAPVGTVTNPYRAPFRDNLGGASPEPQASGEVPELSAVVVDLPEQLQLLDLVGTDKSPYREDGEWAYANEAGGRCFTITQDAKYLNTSRVLLTQAQIVKAVGKKGVTKWAWILHNKDTYGVEEVKENPALVLNAPKADHFHIVEYRKSHATLGQVARAYNVPPFAVKIKPESAFLDCVEYLTHENPNQVIKGKHLYEDSEVRANFNWREDLEEHKLARSFKAGQRANAKKSDKIFQAIAAGEMTLAEVYEQDPSLYSAKGTISHLQKLRGDFLAKRCEAPEAVINFYFFGSGGTGKDLLAKALARSLAPEAKMPYFKVGGDNVSWEGYDAEPVVIWEDCRVGDMVTIAKGRGSLFRILGPWREPDEKPIVNIKNSHTQLLNRVNIVTSPVDYDEFLRGLAGEYESLQGGIKIKHKAENLNQGYRRFPLIIPVGEKEFGIYVNLGFLQGTREYQNYEKYEHMRQDLETLRRRAKSVADAAERARVIEQVESQTVAPIVAQYDRMLMPGPVAAAEDVLAEFIDVGQPIPQPPEIIDAEIVEEVRTPRPTLEDLEAANQRLAEAKAQQAAHEAHNRKQRLSSVGFVVAR